jgi:hypothetical protein
MTARSLPFHAATGSSGCEIAHGRGGALSTFTQTSIVEHVSGSRNLAQAAMAAVVKQ